jgi:hypothetical protein
LATSGVGTFAIAAALCSENITDLHFTNVYSKSHLNPEMLFDTDIKLNYTHLEGYIPVGEWENSDEQRSFILSYGR